MLKKIIKQAIDIHVHVGPEIVPRKFMAQQLVKSELGKIAGIVLKNHFYPTTPFVCEMNDTKGLRIFGSVALNNFLGGLNAEAVYGASLVANRPFFVWFPTISATNFLDKTAYEIAPEWVQKKGFVARRSRDVKGISVTRNGSISKQAKSVLIAIKEARAVLATAHLAWEESKQLVNEALSLGLRNIVVTHPIYQKIAMPIGVQKELALKGCFIEQCFSMYLIDKIPMAKIARQIKAVGVKSVILSSDVGQTFSPPPSAALLRFCKLLSPFGFSVQDFYTMLVENPKMLLGI